MQGYDADENYFSDEGLETSTEALMRKLEQASSPDTSKESKEEVRDEDAADNDSKPPAPAQTARATPRSRSWGEGRFALLLALLAGLGAIVGAFLSSYMRT